MNLNFHESFDKFSIQNFRIDSYIRRARHYLPQIFLNRISPYDFSISARDLVVNPFRLILVFISFSYNSFRQPEYPGFSTRSLFSCFAMGISLVVFFIFSGNPSGFTFKVKNRTPETKTNKFPRIGIEGLRTFFNLKVPHSGVVLSTQVHKQV